MAAARFPLRQQPAPTTHPLEDPMTDTAATQPYIHLDPNGDTLTVRTLPDAALYDGPEPVVSLEIAPPGGEDEPAIVYIRLADVAAVADAIRRAADVLHPAGPAPALDAAGRQVRVGDTVGGTTSGRYQESRGRVFLVAAGSADTAGGAL